MHKILCDGSAAYCLTCKRWMPDQWCAEGHDHKIRVFKLSIHEGSEL